MTSSLKAEPEAQSEETMEYQPLRPLVRSPTLLRRLRCSPTAHPTAKPGTLPLPRPSLRYLWASVLSIGFFAYRSKMRGGDEGKPKVEVTPTPVPYSTFIGMTAETVGATAAEIKFELQVSGSLSSSHSGWVASSRGVVTRPLFFTIQRNANGRLLTRFPFHPLLRISPLKGEGIGGGSSCITEEGASSERNDHL